MRGRHVLGVVAVTAVAVLALSIRAGAADLDRQKKPLRVDVGSLGAPGYLTAEARFALRNKMGNHGQDMVALLMAVTLLRYDTVEAVAKRIASEPRLTRPVVGGEGDVNAALPDRFFVLQDEVRTNAERVREAAEREDDAALAESFGRLTTTCVGCHSTYLSPER